LQPALQLLLQYVEHWAEQHEPFPQLPGEEQLTAQASPLQPAGPFLLQSSKAVVSQEAVHQPAPRLALVGPQFSPRM
jgi:hypothetical protein